MNPQEHIDKIVSSILKSRKMEAPKIRALAKVIEALAKVKVKIEEDNQVPNQPEESMENAMGVNIPLDLNNVEKVNIDGQDHNIRIVPSN